MNPEHIKTFSQIPQLWPSRLQHGDFNPVGTGWLIFA